MVDALRTRGVEIRIVPGEGRPAGDPARPDPTRSGS